jgi:hypothetical protein
MPTEPPIQCEPVDLTPWVTPPEREADRSPLSNAEFKNGVALPLLPHTNPWRSV